MERATRRKKEKMAAYPGVESYRISRVDVTKMDDLCLALSELCVALNFSEQRHKYASNSRRWELRNSLVPSQCAINSLRMRLKEFLWNLGK